MTLTCSTGYYSTFRKVTDVPALHLIPVTPVYICLSVSKYKSPHLKMNGKHLLENDPTLQGSCTSPIIQSQH